MTNDTRQRILAVAQELFIDQGYDGTSLREIADRLGFTKAALYYHFRSKDEILVALLEPGNELLAEFLERLTHADGVAGWADSLVWIINQMFDHIEFFKLLERNRNNVSELGEHLALLTNHLQMHERVEEAVHTITSDLTRAGADGGRTRRGHRLRRLGTAPPRVGAARSTAQRAHRGDARHPEAPPRPSTARRCIGRVARQRELSARRAQTRLSSRRRARTSRTARARRARTWR